MKADPEAGEEVKRATPSEVVTNLHQFAGSRVTVSARIAAVSKTEEGYAVVVKIDRASLPKGTDAPLELRFYPDDPSSIGKLDDLPRGRDVEMTGNCTGRVNSWVEFLHTEFR